MLMLERNLKSILLTAILLAISGSRANDEAEKKPENETPAKPEEAPQPEPPFPVLIDSNQKFIHIVTENFVMDLGMQTSEEYLDLSLFRSAFVTKDKRGRAVTLVDARQDLMYRYRDYSCSPLKVSELNQYKSGLWLAETSQKLPEGGTWKLTVYGIAAIWINAGRMAKVYKRTARINSGLRKFKKHAHRWTVEHPETKTLAHLYFVEAESSSESGAERGPDRLELETIQILSTMANKVIRTINILEVDNVIPMEVRSELLEVPVGYGCHGEKGLENNSKFQFNTMDMMSLGRLLRQSNRLVLEVTLTKFETVTESETSDKTRKIIWDTINVELAKTNHVGEDDLQMVYQRDTNIDTKVVYDHYLNVQYDIDLKRGKCKIASMGNTMGDDDEQRIVLKFANTNTELKMDLLMMNELFISTDEFYFIKEVQNPDSSLLYFEKTAGDLFPGKNARIIRIYSVDKDTKFKLETVMIKVYDELLTSITTTYHINIVEAVELNSKVDMAKLFDVSEECYLNNELMKSGKDYVWLELSYSIPIHLIKTVQQNVDNLRVVARELLMERDIYIINSPRLEIELNEDMMLLRILLLDLPPLPVLYERKPDTTFVCDKNEGDLEDLTQDLDHCANLCRLHRCKLFSFSQATFLCQLASSSEDNLPLRRSTPSVGYFLFSMPQKEGRVYDNLFRSSLHNMIADLQHKDYDFKIPPMPEELRLTASETGISISERNKISRQYFDDLNKLRRDNRDKIPILSFIIMFQGASVPIIPSRIEVDRDPLEEFDLFDKRASLSGSDDDLEDAMPSTASFHLGLSMHHYVIAGLTQEAETRARSMKFHDLTYEQCALACVDGKCSSFSYCNNRQECILTDIWDIGAKMSSKAVERDADCFIAQRDFISKFNKFSATARPSVYRKSVAALNPSECAHACVIETDYNCLAFDYCPTASNEPMTLGPLPEGQGGTCFYRSERFISTGNPNITAIVDQLKPSRRHLDINGCDHYSRSYLADFTRIEYRAIDELVLGKLKSETFEGFSVDQCADKCVNDLSDCTAFQFCFNPNDPNKSRRPMQKCVMIDSKPEGLTDEDLKVVVRENSTSEELLKVSKLFQQDDLCHVFSLRKDASEAHLRDLALNAISADDYERKQKGSRVSSSFTLAGCFHIFLSFSILSAGFVSALLVARDKSVFIRRHTDNIQALIVRN